MPHTNLATTLTLIGCPTSCPDVKHVILYVCQYSNIILFLIVELTILTVKPADTTIQYQSS